jgi:hypothetical protein
MDAIWGLIGALIGALASIATTWITTCNASTQQIASAEYARSEQNRAFQRETLLELQMAVSDLMRLVSRAQLEDRKAFHAGTEWRRNMLDQALDADMGISFRDVSLLTARVADDQLRADVKSAIESAAKVSLAAEGSAAVRQFDGAMHVGMRLMERIGDSLRKQY